MQHTEIYPTFAEIVADSLGIDSSTVTMESTLEELGAESLDVVEISMEAESRFNVWLPDKSILETAIEVIGRDALLEDGRLSEYGKELFRARLAREEWTLLEGEVTEADLREYFMRVSTWVQMIVGLRAHTPAQCPACNAAELRDRPGFTLLCEQCGHETKLRSGQEINREWVQQFAAERQPARVGSGSMKAVEGSAAV